MAHPLVPGEEDTRVTRSRGRKGTQSVFLGAVLICLFISTVCQAKEPRVDHVLVIGCDGFGSVGFTPSNTPVLHRLMREGCFTLHARGVMPTVSSPNWASMIMGAGPEQHGVTSNDWQQDKYEIPPICHGSGGIFPTIFGVLREERPSSIIACFTDWDGFIRLVEPKAPDAMT